MTTDFEQGLRDRLHAQAEAVRPDPETWTKVTRGIRRRQLLGWTAAGVAAAGLAVLAVLVVPRLDPAEVDLAPGASAPEVGDPAPLDTDSARPDPGAPVALGGFVITDGASIFRTDPSGQHQQTLARGDETVLCAGRGCRGRERITAVAVRPGSSSRESTAAYHLSTGCGDLSWGTFREGVVGGPGGGVPHTDGSCPGAPVFSPDGAHAAWVATEPGRPGAFTLHTIGWRDGPGTGDPADDNASWELEVPGLVSLRLTDWVWEGTAVAGGSSTRGAATTGALYLTGSDGTEQRAYVLQLERQDDGALVASTSPVEVDVALTFDRSLEEAALDAGLPASARRLVVADDHRTHGPARAPAFSLFGTDDGAVGIERAGGGHYLLDEALLTTADARGGDLWLVAWAGTAVFGDGWGRAWTTTWEGEGFGAPTELPGDVVHAGVLVDVASDAAPAPEPEDLSDGLPDPVSDTRRAILDAVAAGDIDALLGLMGPTFTASFGAPAEEVFRRLADQGELDLVAGVLQTPVGRLEQEGAEALYVWPSAHARAPEEWTEEDLAGLRQLGTEDEIAEWRAFGGYLGWRAGIAADGTWLYFVAGD